MHNTTTDGIEHEEPTTCENPESDCQRITGLRPVLWAEDYTSDTPNQEYWLCEPCAMMLKRGTRVSPNELIIRSTETGAE